MTWSLSHIEKLKAAGKIKGYSNAKIQKRVERPESKGLTWLKVNLQVWCDQNKMTLQYEYRFDAERKWRADFHIREIRTLIEYEGLVSEKSRHTTIKGYTGDSEKYNRAIVLGYRVLRFTALNYQTALKSLNEIVK